MSCLLGGGRCSHLQMQQGAPDLLQLQVQGLQVPGVQGGVQGASREIQIRREDSRGDSETETAAGGDGIRHQGLPVVLTIISLTTIS